MVAGMFTLALFAVFFGLAADPERPRWGLAAWATLVPEK